MAHQYIPIGFRFSPTDLELITFYLRPKIDHQQSFDFLEEMDVYGKEPWLLQHEITDPSLFNDNEWYCFVKRTKAREKDAKRTKRTVKNHGTWKISGTAQIYDENKVVVGYKQSLTFLIKDEIASSEKEKVKKNAVKTDWLMKEYRLDSNMFQEWVICRIYNTKRQGDGAVKEHVTEPSSSNPGGFDSNAPMRNEGSSEAVKKPVRNFDLNLLAARDEGSDEERQQLAAAADAAAAADDDDDGGGGGGGGDDISVIGNNRNV